MKFKDTEEERAIGALFAAKNGLPETAEAIRAECYKDIVRTLAEEAGVERAIRLIAEAGVARWAFYFAYHVPGLTETHLSELFGVVHGAEEDPGWAHYFARDVLNLT